MRPDVIATRLPSGESSAFSSNGSSGLRTPSFSPLRLYQLSSRSTPSPPRQAIMPEAETEKEPDWLSGSIATAGDKLTKFFPSCARSASNGWATSALCRTLTSHPGARYSAAESEPEAMVVSRRGGPPSSELIQLDRPDAPGGGGPRGGGG